MTIHPLLLSVCAALALSACGEKNRVAQEFEGSCWRMRDTLAFTHDNPQAGSAFSPEITIGFLPDYVYQNIHLKIRLTAPSGATTETLFEGECIDVAGNWVLAKDGSQFQGVFQPKPLALAEKGTYKVQLLHNMRDTSVCEIAHCEVK